MTQTSEAIFHAEYSTSPEPLELEPNTHVRIVIESLPQNGALESKLQSRAAPAI